MKKSFKKASVLILSMFMIVHGYNSDGSSDGNKIGKALASTTGRDSGNGEGAVGNNPSSNNSSGFTALSSGLRDHDYYGGSFISAGNYAMWWSSTQRGSSTAYYRNLWYGDPYLSRHRNAKSYGFSVRCVKD